jgi:hypothetical protein
MTQGTFTDGFSWQGSLDETDVRALYAACHTLRFSGHLELKDAAHEARVIFVGGEPLEVSGGDPQTVPVWEHGTFRAVQSIPDLEGELTDGRELAGSLAETRPSALWAWIGQCRLSCEIELERPGSRAVVAFQNGHAESAQVNGLPELAALARVSSWTDGTFSVRLRPLFAGGVVPLGGPEPEPAPPIGASGREFDVSRSMPLELGSSTPWPGERDVDSDQVPRIGPSAATA